MRNRLILIVAAMALLIVAIPVAASAGGSYEEVTKEMVRGGWSCPDGTKIDTGAPGTYEVYVDGDKVTITLEEAPRKKVRFTVEGKYKVETVLVKGGPDALLWYFDPVRTSAAVHAPKNLKNGKFYGVSHLCFLIHKKTSVS